MPLDVMEISCYQCRFYGTSPVSLCRKRSTARNYLLVHDQSADMAKTCKHFMPDLESKKNSPMRKAKGQSK